MNLSGKKTYIIAGAMILWAILGAIIGKHDANTALQEIFVALGMMGLRNGIPKKE